ncbi:hypothetical protein [Tropicibacter sp. S64]|uniref:hypothetical protein n=1 Tax=Tropicibacter sp. S64 TaxID=3415122 RepID=UPI003C797F9F
MAELSRADLSAWDILVPMTFVDQDVLRNAGMDGRGALVPEAWPRDLCRDKLVLNRWLIDAGFCALVPRMYSAPPGAGSAWPLMRKARRGEWGSGIAVLSGPSEAGAIDPDTTFLQEIVSTGVEWAAHLTLHGGQLIHAASVRHDMGSAGLVKGRDNKPVRSTLVPEVPHLALWMEIAAALGLRNGTICIDFAQVAGRPVLYEINPRFGASLVRDLPRYLDALSQVTVPVALQPDHAVSSTVIS